MINVLLVEDEELIRQGMRYTTPWEQYGCEVIGEAKDGVEGIEKILELKPDIVITDVKMPKMDGLEMLEKLRDRGCEAYVIILTAYDSFTYAQQALRLGAVDFLLKPFHDGDLENAVLRLQRKLAKKAETPEIKLPEVRSGIKSRYVQEAMDCMGKNCGDPNLSISQIAGTLGLSEGHLSHLFKKETGITVGAYLTRCRIQKAMGLLRQGKCRVYEVAESCGYRDITYFSGTFKKMTGMSPSEYQNKG